MQPALCQSEVLLLLFQAVTLVPLSYGDPTTSHRISIYRETVRDIDVTMGASVTLI